MKIYLDVCCLNRPFDDLSHDRIRLEAEAILIIFQRMKLYKDLWLSSDLVNFEVNRIPDTVRKETINHQLTKVSKKLKLDSISKQYADELLKYGFSPMDALHLAIAETNECEIFLSTDDFILRKSNAVIPPLRMRVLNPAIWIMELNDNEQ